MTEILRKLYALSEERWDHYTLSRDPLYHRMSQSLRRQSVCDAQLTGRAAARTIAYRERCGRPEELCGRYGIRVWEESAEEGCGRYLLAQFQEPYDIVLYTQPIQKIQRLMERSLPETNGALVQELILAHELYHVLEIRESEFAPREVWVPIFELGRISWKRRVTAVSEIAAMAFARELLDIPFAPQMLDMLLLFAEEDPHAFVEAERILAMP